MRQFTGWFKGVGCAVVLAGAGLLGTGCTTESLQLARVRANPSPELGTLGMSHQQVVNRMVATNDQAMRAAYLDLLRIMLLVDHKPTSVVPAP